VALTINNSLTPFVEVVILELDQDTKWLTTRGCGEHDSIVVGFTTTVHSKCINDHTLRSDIFLPKCPTHSREMSDKFEGKKLHCDKKTMMMSALF
jgi:hypothetical protein